MAKFTEIEKLFIEKIKDDRLHDSLAIIRNVAEKIWNTAEVPRIIQDFTDHGIDHSVRIANFAQKLIEANDSIKLTDMEMYLLLASIYLHDIGMQCDVVKYLDIKERAEKLGAHFNIEFDAEATSRYSIDEQKEIRRNHQYLTAAWIQHAYHTGNTILGPATTTIPNALVGDLMDICKFHAKLSIFDCPITFKNYATQRKQMVAALLRFADELDVDGHRVSIETVQTFRLDPHNSVYWWLHNQTTIEFIAPNVLLMTIRLHPDDLKSLGSFFYAAFINEFQIKNRPVLRVLRQNNISIFFDADSEVIDDENAERLPPEITQAIKDMQQTGEPINELVDEVRTWLQVIRYEAIEINQRDHRTVDMVATLELGSVKQRVLVRCIGGQIELSDVEALDKALSLRVPRGWLICDRRVAEKARESADENDSIQVFSLIEFLQQMIWGPYFDALKLQVEKANISNFYVDLRCYKQEVNEEGQELNREEYDSLDTYIDDWVKERGSGHISLLGEFGGGKTWFCFHYAYRQLKRYFDNPTSERLPLVITLRSFSKAMTVQQLINDALLEQYNLPIVGSAYDVFKEMNRGGKLLLILDGFDEMAQKVDYDKIVDNFWELTKLVDKNSKVILTCRNEYFHWARQHERILSGDEFNRRTIILSAPIFDVIQIEHLNEEQIHEVIDKRIGLEAGALAKKIIFGSRNLAEIARKPIVVELLLTLIDESNLNKLENIAQVYQHAIEKLLVRNIERKGTFTSHDDKLYFLSELAWEMIKNEETLVHFTILPEKIKKYFGMQIKNGELESWEWDLHSQTVLHRNEEGYYYFSHKSFAEYFVSLKLIQDLRKRDYYSWNYKRLGHSISMFLRQMFDPGDFDLLVDLLHKCEALEEARGQTVHHMRYFNETKAKPFLKQWLNNEKSIRVKKSILSSLSYFGENTSRETFELFDENPSFSKEYAEYVVDYYSGISSAKRKLISHLKGNEYLNNRASHIFVLGRIGDETCVKSIEPFLSDDDEYVAKTAKSAIQYIHSRA